MKKLPILFAFTGILILGSCSPRYSYFTEDLYESHNWSQSDIRKIQFYVSRDIQLTREVRAGQTRIAEGKILMKNGRRLEQVIIRAGTPGVLVLMPREDRFAISFDTRDDAYLMFGPNPNYHNRFALLAQDWDKQKGTVHYRGNEYTVTAENALAALMVDLRKTGNIQQTRHTAQGRKVKG